MQSTTRTLTLNNHLIFVEMHGQVTDPAVVFLHHGLGSTYSWRSQIEAFSKGDYYVIAYDRWGYGKSESRPYLSVPDFRQDLLDLEALLDALNIEKVALIGHSDGGTIALYFTVEHPKRVSCLVTVAAHIYVEPQMIKGIESIHKAFQEEARFREGLKRMHAEKNEAVFYNWYQAWMKPEHLTWDMQPLLSSIRCPTLVIQGLLDEHATPQHAKDLAACIPNAQLWLVPEANHMLPQNITNAFNQKVEGFIKQVLQDKSLRNNLKS